MPASDSPSIATIEARSKSTSKNSEVHRFNKRSSKSSRSEGKILRDLSKEECIVAVFVRLIDGNSLRNLSLYLLDDGFEYNSKLREAVTGGHRLTVRTRCCGAITHFDPSKYGFDSHWPHSHFSFYFLLSFLAQKKV